PFHWLQANGFRFYFTPLTGVLFTFPSQYLCTIGRRHVFSLGKWSSRLPPTLHVGRGTWVRNQRITRNFNYRTITFYGLPFQAVRLSRKRLIRPPSPGYPHCAPQPRLDLRPIGLGYSPFARRYLGNLFLISLPGGTEMFHFPPFAS